MEAARVGVSVTKEFIPYVQRPIRQNHVSDYLHGAVDPVLRRRHVEEGVRQLSQMKFDAIAVTGFSGISVGSILADRLGKALLFVRKGRNEEDTHSHHDLEGPLDWTPKPARYVVVDDFIAGGETVRRVQRLIGGRAEFVGIYLWRDQDFIDIEEARERRLLPETPARPRRAN